ncbi:MAG: alkaline phosphatase family protein [Terriglobales bacterium]
MSFRRSLPLILMVGALTGVFSASPAAASPNKIKRVLLISIDGMHALDFANCRAGVDGGSPYCPNLAKLAHNGVNYLQTLTPRPSDSFPGLTALVTGGLPRTTGAFYDVSYNRALSPPTKTTPYGIVGGKNLCPNVIGTQVGYDEEIDKDLTKLSAGGGINPDYLPRDPNNGCAPVYPHTYLRVNTIFEVVKASGGYTAWSDKHQSYELTKGPSGIGVDDFFAPEINSPAVPIPSVPGCNPLPDTTSLADWTSSFANIKCYDTYKVQAILNEIDGKTHDGKSTASVPTVFGMNFQAVSIGQKLNEKSIGVTGGYTDALGTPTDALMGEITFVDASIGRMIEELQDQGLYDSTLIIITAKHGQSPIDPNRLLRIPGDNSALEPPSQVLSPSGIGPGFPVVQALEDDVSLIWLADQSQINTDAALLSANLNLTGGGEVLAGKNLDLIFNSPLVDPATPDIIVTPNIGVVYTGGTKKVAEHGGFAQDDRNVMLLIANSHFKASTFDDQVETRQVAPTILKALGLDPHQLKAVQIEKTAVLPGLPF